MKSKDRLNRFAGFKRVFNLRLWSDVDRLKSFAAYIADGVKAFVVPQPKKPSESFLAAVERLDLTEADLLARKRALFRLSCLSAGMAVFILVYACYQLLYGSFHGFLLTLSVFSIALVFAFRYHFWYFQINQGKLGCTVKEWFKYGLLGEKR